MGVVVEIIYECPASRFLVHQEQQLSFWWTLKGAGAASFTPIAQTWLLFFR